MSPAELKTDILKLIVETEDTSILEKVKDYLTKLTKSNKTDWWDKLSERDKQEVFLGDMELQQGKGIPHAEVRKQIDKLLGK